MAYYALEALIVGVFITLVWKLLISQYLGNLGYFPIVGIYWIAKMILFDVFKLIAGLSSAGSNMEREMEINAEEESNTLQPKDFR
jgi:hypothetical protein